MTNEVMISIIGEQMDIDENDKTELITFGRHYLKNGRHFIMFEEIQADNEQPIYSMIKMAADKMEILRKGGSRSHMIFEKGKKNMTSYMTPAGPMMMSLFTDDMTYKEDEDRIDAEVNYSFSMNELFISRSRVTICIQSKDHARLNLMS